MKAYILHYNTHAEKRYFLGDYRDSYDLVAFNGNIVSHTPASIAGFIATVAKDFYIDPQTHAFQHATHHLKRKTKNKDTGREEWQFKPSIETLAKDRLGSVFGRVIDEDRPLTPDDFFDENGEMNSAIVEEVCEAVIEFQNDFLNKELDEETKDFLDDDELFPKLIIAPYFYLSVSGWDKWVQISHACYRHVQTKYTREGQEIFLELVLSKDLIYSEEISSIILGKIAELKPQGVLLWIDEHEEEQLSIQAIAAYKSFLEKLRSHTAKIFNIHGGYLSSLLTHSELTPRLDGVGHSVNYGEHRAVVPVGGGIPLARFFMLSVHSRLKYADAATIIFSKGWQTPNKQYLEKVCSCVQCRQLIDEYDSAERAFEAYGESKPVTFTRGRGSIVQFEYPTSEAKQLASAHYLNCKAREVADIRNTTAIDLVHKLKKDFCEMFDQTGSEVITHLLRWYNALKEELK